MPWLFPFFIIIIVRTMKSGRRLYDKIPVGSPRRVPVQAAPQTVPVILSHLLENYGSKVSPVLKPTTSKCGNETTPSLSLTGDHAATWQLSVVQRVKLVPV